MRKLDIVRDLFGLFKVDANIIWFIQFIDPATKEAKKQRWVNIDLIKKKLDETDVQERPDLRELLPFKRKDRKTVKEAEQHYQKKIN